MKIKFNLAFLEIENFEEFFKTNPEATIYNENNQELFVVTDWKKEGNTWVKDYKQIYSKLVQQILDTKAQEHSYDNIVSACSYCTFENQFKEESLSFFNWRTAAWIKMNEIFIQVESGTRTLPTIEELIAEIPAFV